MRRILVVGLLLLTGCQGVRGPLWPRSPERVDDPYLSIDEQQRNGRERLALPDETQFAGPKQSGNRFGLPTQR